MCSINENYVISTRFPAHVGCCRQFMNDWCHRQSTSVAPSVALVVTDTLNFTLYSYLVCFSKKVYLHCKLFFFFFYLRKKNCECLSVTCKSLLDNTCYSSEVSGDIMVGFKVRIVQCYMWNLRKDSKLHNSSLHQTVHITCG